MIETKDRTYLATHPWISFRLDLRKASYRVWMLLGNAQSKCEAVKGIPLLPSVSEHLYQVFLAKGILGTTAIEGNTLSEDEVLELLEGKLQLPPSKEYLAQEIDNIVEACNLIRNQVMSGEQSNLQTGDILEFNRLVFKELSTQEDFVPGEFRTHEVGVGNYKGAPYANVEYLVDRLFTWLNADFDTPEGYEVAIAILKAILAHLYIAWIHPFGDGNGRTARLIEFEILLAAGLPDVVAHLFSNHYNQTRTEYYRQLDASHRSFDGVFEFIEYALQGFVDGLNNQLDMIRGQQLHVHWINYIHSQFRDKHGAADVRRRRLAIDLSNKDEPVKVSEIRYVSTRIAEAYADLSDKTVSRDVQKLQQMDLVTRTKEGVIANREVMKAFMPATIENG